MLALNVKNLSYTYPGALEPSLRGIDLSLESGKFFALLGPNGAGKSSFFSVLTGLLTGFTGTVDLFGKRTYPRLSKETISLIPQGVALYVQLTARENLAFFGRLYGMHGRALESRIEEVLGELQLSTVADRLVRTFSGGMQRRLNLAVGILQERSILLIDEPTVGVDPQSRQLIYRILQELNSKGATIIYSTHYLEEVARLCHDFAIIDKGAILYRSAHDPDKDAEGIEQRYLRLTGLALKDG